MSYNNTDKTKSYLICHDKYNCYGCGACEIVCPTAAISMKNDEKGFSYPFVENKKCIKCGLCESVCIYGKEQEKQLSHELYAAQNVSSHVLENCQSGGVFDALSDAIIENGGVVFGAIIDENLSVRHIGTNEKKTRDKMRGSKYVKSELSGDVLRQIGKELSENKEVLFTGTPCQCAAVEKLYENYNNLYTLDFICHGTPSQKLYQNYIKWFESETNTQITRVVFRMQHWKSKGLHSMLLEDINGRKYYNSDYSAFFYSHLGHREACLNCGFASKNRQSDLTMGGFLDKDFFEAFGNKYSVSMCIINSEKGKELFNKSRNRMIVKKIDYKNLFFKQQPALYHSVEKPTDYDDFWLEYLNNGYVNAIAKYVPKYLYEKYHLIDEIDNNCC